MFKDFVTDLSQGMGKVMSIRFFERTVARDIRNTVKSMFADATPSESMKDEWRVIYRKSAASFEINFSRSAPEGHQIQAALLLGARRKPWVIEPVRKEVLMFFTDTGEKVFTKRVNRRRAHLDGKWVHSNFRGIERRIKNRVDGILRRRYGITRSDMITARIK